MIKNIFINQTLEEIAVLRRKHAKQETPSWFYVAECALALLESDNIKALDMPSVLNSAAEAAGCQVNTFRRQVRLVKFLKTHEKELDIVERKAEVANLSVSAVEMCVRLFGILPIEGKEGMHQLLDKGATFSQIRDAYQTRLAEVGAVKASPKSGSRTRVASFAELASKTIQERKEMLYPSSLAANAKIVMTARVRLDLARPDFVAAGNSLQAPAWLDAFEFKLLSTDNSRSSKLPLLERAAFLSMLFRNVWLVFPTDISLKTREDVILPLNRDLTALDLLSVGIMLIGRGDSTLPMEVLRAPEARNGDEPPIQMRLRQQIAQQTPNEYGVKNFLGEAQSSKKPVR